MDIEAKKEQYARIRQRIENEVGSMDGIEFLILFLELTDADPQWITDVMAIDLPDKVKRACQIIAEELGNG